MKLSTEQLSAYDSVMKWMKTPGKRRFVLSGYAGTGKTTLAKYLADNSGVSVGFLAYTGKACQVLREKGCHNCSTIHSHLYTPTKEKDGTIHFTLKHHTEIAKYNLLIVDEYSMIPEELIVDIEESAIKVLYLGDDFQLTPIKGKNVFKKDIQLIEVHRQALESNIIRIATGIRNNVTPAYCKHDDFVYSPASKMSFKDVFMPVDMRLCGKHTTRRKWIDRFREERGYTKLLPSSGEDLLCIRNNKEQGLYNGMTVVCNDDVWSKATSQVKPTVVRVKLDGRDNIPVWTGEFLGFDHKSQKFPIKYSTGIFDYAYAMTVHKSQGSEWDSILVYNDPIGDSPEKCRKWLYTAVTRARKRVYLID